ncbi:MAG: nucleotidyltransferase family protein [Candidatus Omnitrophota bacterium]
MRYLDKARLFKSNASKIYEFSKVLAKLNDHDIYPIVLKGAYLCEKIYGDLGARPFSDVDILVKRDGFRGVEKVLLDAGYAYTVPGRVGFSLKYGSQVSFSKDDAAIDVHWDIVDLCRFNRVTSIEIGEFWDRSRIVDMFGGKVAELEPEDLVLYLLLHLSLQHSFQLDAPYKDIRYTLAALGPGLRWDEIIDRAQRYRVTRPAYLGLFLSRKFEHADIPESVLSALRPRTMGPLDRSICNLLSAGERFDGIDCLILPFMLDTWRQRIRFTFDRPGGSVGYLFHSAALIMKGIKKFPRLLKYLTF